MAKIRYLSLFIYIFDCLPQDNVHFVYFENVFGIDQRIRNHRNVRYITKKRKKKELFSNSSSYIVFSCILFPLSYYMGI